VNSLHILKLYKFLTTSLETKRKLITVNSRRYTLKFNTKQLQQTPIQLQMLVAVDQLLAKTVSFGPELILEMKAMRADY
jgi:hypothetical protein